jgi:hypothetical protein
MNDDFRILKIEAFLLILFCFVLVFVGRLNAEEYSIAIKKAYIEQVDVYVDNVLMIYDTDTTKQRIYVDGFELSSNYFIRSCKKGFCLDIKERQ